MGKHTNINLILSPSGLNTFASCVRCGFLEYHTYAYLSCPRPRGIFPTLPNGIDKIVKKYHDMYRSRNILPPYLNEHISGVLYPNLPLVKELRHWKTGPTVNLEYKKGVVTLRGALDDLILREDGKVSPFDSKSKGFIPKDDGAKYYQLQLDCYDFMLQENGYRTTGEGVLAYIWPEIMGDKHKDISMNVTPNITPEAENEMVKNLIVEFDSQVYTLTTDANRGKTALLHAADIILAGELPSAKSDCEQCIYVEQREWLENSIKGEIKEKMLQHTTSTV